MRKRTQRNNSGTGTGDYTDDGRDDSEDNVPEPEYEPGIVRNEITLPPPKQSSQYYKEQVGTTPGQTSTSKTLTPFSEEQRKIDLRTAEVKLSTCTTRYGQADFCEKIVAPVVDVIKCLS